MTLNRRAYASLRTLSYLSLTVPPAVPQQSRSDVPSRRCSAIVVVVYGKVNSAMRGGGQRRSMNHRARVEPREQLVALHRAQATATQSQLIFCRTDRAGADQANMDLDLKYLGNNPQPPAFTCCALESK